MTEQVILSFDPGDITGWARFKRSVLAGTPFNARENALPSEEQLGALLWHFDGSGFFDAQLQLDKLIPLITELPDESLILAERVKVLRTGVSDWGIHVNGALKLASIYWGKPLEMRHPSMLQGPRRWPYVYEWSHNPDHRLSAHEQDAILHVVGYLGAKEVAGAIREGRE